MKINAQTKFLIVYEDDGVSYAEGFGANEKAACEARLGQLISDGINRSTTFVFSGKMLLADFDITVKLYEKRSRKK